MKTEIEPQKSNIPLTERLKSIPEMFGIRVNEEPKYKVLKTDGNFEVRRYEKQLIAKITMHGMSFDYFREHAFEKLADYIFEGNVKNKSIPMTSPVYQEETGAGVWSMSFILPKEYTLATAPQPKNSDIVLEVVEPYEVACVSYSGHNSMDKIKLHERELAAWLIDHSEYVPTGKYMITQYDAPFVIPFLKKNEIQVKLKYLHQPSICAVLNEGGVLSFPINGHVSPFDKGK